MPTASITLGRFDLTRLTIIFMRNRGEEKKSVCGFSGFAEQERKKVNKLYSFLEEDDLFS